VNITCSRRPGTVKFYYDTRPHLDHEQRKAVIATAPASIRLSGRLATGNPTGLRSCSGS